jgi:hypothetical protein
MKSKNGLKIPTIKVLADDCSISIGQVIEDGEITTPGTPHYVHVGEWVEVMPVLTVREVMHLSRLRTGSDDGTGLGDSLGKLCQELSKRLLSWNWTDLLGEAMEQPHNRPDVLEELSADELLWLVNATSETEQADARKKDSKPSETTS